MRRQVENWKESRIGDEQAKLVIYRAFVERELEAPKHFARRVHELYFYPPYEEFADGICAGEQLPSHGYKT